MHNNKKREYTSPEIEILNARVERGFDGSNIDNTTGNERYAMSEDNLGKKFSELLKAAAR